ncbi:MAG: NAD(P)/FAD-dependent oxidoreductase [Actinobacteria bacterium]|nr:NAD(P)/FAD-dependent oxidoreductase [Actinomycetota bacterium]
MTTPTDPGAADGRHLRFAVIGAGMAGILSAIKLLEAGLDDFCVYEKADRPGGTWRENTYPGIACDVPSHLYSYSFELNPEWSHLFSPGQEILAYFERVVAHHDLDRFIRYGDEVVRCDYADGRWHLETASGHTDVVDVVIAATGVLHHPRHPDIEGIDTFGGAMFHSARWDHDVPIAGKRVGVIGTGSTAVQIVAAIVGEAGHVSMFQRTAQWIMPQLNPPYSDDDKASFRADPSKMTQMHDNLSQLFEDGFANAVVDADSPQIKLIEQACLDNLESNVRDAELRELLRPNYRAACKRLVISGDFYDAIQQPNAELVTSPIERIELGGVRTTERLHELDVLVLATGFRVDAFMRPIEVTGRHGVTLEKVWAHRPSAYLSISIPDFPNLFMLNGPNGPVGNFSLIEVAELQFAYIMQLVDRLRSNGCREISATHGALDEWETAREEAAKKTVWVTGCRSWYLDDRGIPAAWPWRFTKFRDDMATPNPDHYELI